MLFVLALSEGTVVEVVLSEEEVARAAGEPGHGEVEGRPLGNEPLAEVSGLSLEPLLDGEVVVHEESEPLVAKFEVISGGGPHKFVLLLLLFRGHFV